MTTEEVLQRMIEWKANPDFFGKNPAPCLEKGWKLYPIFSHYPNSYSTIPLNTHWHP